MKQKIFIIITITNYNYPVLIFCTNPRANVPCGDNFALYTILILRLIFNNKKINIFN